MDWVLEGGRRLLYGLYVPLATALAAVVPTGYFVALRTSYPNLSVPTLALIAFAAVVAVLLLVVHTGRSLYQAYRTRRWLPVLIAAGSFTCTLIVSAFGVFSAGLLLFEGPVIAREMLTLSRDQMLALNEKASDALRASEFDEMKARVERWRSTFEREIYNPSFCGVGVGAKAALSEIQKDLPNVKLHTGSDQRIACTERARLDAIRDNYRKSITDSLEAHPLQVSLRIPDRAKAAAEVKSVVAADRTLIDNALLVLDRIHNFVGRFSDFDTISALLTRVKSDYSALYQRLSGLVGAQKLAVSPTLENGQLLKAASGFQVLGVALTRLDRITTWIYGLIALASDIVVVFLAAHAVAVQRLLREQRQRFETDHAMESDVAFIWSPVRNPSAPVAADPNLIRSN